MNKIMVGQNSNSQKIPIGQPKKVPMSNLYKYNYTTIKYI